MQLLVRQACSGVALHRALPTFYGQPSRTTCFRFNYLDDGWLSAHYCPHPSYPRPSDQTLERTARIYTSLISLCCTMILTTYRTLSYQFKVHKGDELNECRILSESSTGNVLYAKSPQYQLNVNWLLRFSYPTVSVMQFSHSGFFWYFALCCISSCLRKAPQRPI